ncbi:UPF0147 family protein [Candidatus Woesearchaeota archaeon]|nr:UPF0147 family protein [Candidatus Woesearchaeota archaeon]
MMIKAPGKMFDDVISVIAELQGDFSVPRNVKEKLQLCASALQENTEISLRVDRVKQAIDQICDDVNLESYTRMQLWNISSMLEKL